jgi:hypothetical protein
MTGTGRAEFLEARSMESTDTGEDILAARQVASRRQWTDCADFVHLPERFSIEAPGETARDSQNSHQGG